MFNSELDNLCCYIIYHTCTYLWTGKQAKATYSFFRMLYGKIHKQAITHNYVLLL